MKCISVSLETGSWPHKSHHFHACYAERQQMERLRAPNLLQKRQ